ncbi:MAG: hypothetical protein IT337_08460, partial [Thermomicrobiales bacterium]|nr:hypothetical protein [Thermomicrobiales bacterium]
MNRLTAPVVALIALVLLGAPLQHATAQQAAPAATDGTFPGASAPQPSYDVLRVEQDGKIFPYHVWVDWLPDLVTLPDGGAWIFFGAQVRADKGLGPRKIYRARFDVGRQVWLPASAMPGGDVQFGPAAVVDGAGIVHVVYSASSAGDPANSATLMYARI